MSTTVSRPIYHKPATAPLPPLENGEMLDQPTFHARYKAMPGNVRAELVEGIVYMSAAVSAKHGEPHQHVSTWIGVYAASTPATKGLLDTTAILGKQSEPQPDVALLIRGGQTTETEDGYIEGVPELACEIANSTESIDLHAKKRDYEKYGAREYLVVAVRIRQVFWFVRGGDGKFTDLPADADGIIRSRIYPGLWLDPAALLAGNLAGVLAVVNQGIASPEHVEFARSINPVI